jgi:hypothetical protein
MAKVGDLQIDLSDMASFLVDVETTRGLQSEKEGLAEAQAELYGNQAEFGAAAKISDEEILAIREIDAKIKRIDEVFPAIDKIRERLIESRAVLDDKREKAIHAVADIVDLVGKTRPEVLAQYQRVRRYRSATALKGVKTREKKESEEKKDPT